MTRASALLIVMACALSAGRATDAQQTRDAGQPPALASGTARIAGRVETLEASPQPLRRVIVTLTGDQLPGGRTTISDAEGRFAFERLPAGRFMLTGTKAAYVPGAYGANRPGRPAVPLQIATGDVRSDVTFAMARGAVISGVLRDAAGEPAPGVEVAALRFPAPGAPSTLVFTRFATTDDRGAYRIYGLMPGDYLVSSLMKPGGRHSDIAAMSGAQIDAALLDLQRRSGPGAAPPAERAEAMVPPGNYAITPVFYPGTPGPDAAAKITLATGEERDGIDFIVRMTRMATIEGVVIDGGNPIKPLIINPAGVEMPSLAGAAPSFTWQATPTGRTFKYTNVVPGRYVITAESTATGVAWARTEVDVAGDDLTGITLVMQPALRLTGRIVFDGKTQAPPPDLSVVGLRLVSPRGSGTSAMGYTRMGQAYIPAAYVETDGRFELVGVMPDTYRIVTALPPTLATWWLRSAIVNGVDVLDTPLEFGGAGDINGAVLTFSDRHTTLSGTIMTTAGQPAPAYFIAVFPLDRALWRPQARRIQSTRAGTDGSWIVRGLPAGEYLVAALSDLALEDLADAAFLGELVAASVRVTLGDGEQRKQDLRIAR